MFHDSLISKSPEEKTAIKSQAIAKLEHRGKFASLLEYGFQIEILSLVEIPKGVEVLVRAWQNNRPLGFGKDGSVEIERLRIFNPPILIPDPNGNIIIEGKNKDGVPNFRKFREDPIEAIRQSLAHTIKVVGKENTPIVRGKVGNTTSTFYPTVQYDLYIVHYGSNTWATIRDAATGTGVGGTGATTTLFENSHYNSPNYFQVVRYQCPFDTSAIPDTDTIDSGTFSLYGATGSQNDETVSIGIVEGKQANFPPLVADYSAMGTTEFATRIALSAWSTAGYNDFALNASGLTAVSKTGNTMYCVRGSLDLDNTAPGAAVKVNYCTVNTSTQTGTTQDPKLVIVHSATATGLNSFRSLLGVGI